MGKGENHGVAEDRNFKVKMRKYSDRIERQSQANLMVGIGILALQVFTGVITMIDNARSVTKSIMLLLLIAAMACTLFGMIRLQKERSFRYVCIMPFMVAEFKAHFIKIIQRFFV